MEENQNAQNNKKKQNDTCCHTGVPLTEPAEEHKNKCCDHDANAKNEKGSGCHDNVLSLSSGIDSPVIGA